MARIHAVDKDARADVAELAIRGTRGTPVLSRVGKRFDVRIEADEPVELRGVDRWELGFDPVFGVLRGGNVSRHKNCAFVRNITIEITPLSINQKQWWLIVTYPYIAGTFTKRPDSNILTG